MSNLLAAYDRSRVPRYVQVASVFRQKIQSGEWKPGQKIATLEQLQREFQVARVTIRQAVELLSQEGLLGARRGSGTFVAASPPARQWLTLEATWDALVESVKANKPKVINVKRQAPPPVLKAGEGHPADRYVAIESIQDRDGQPFSVVDLRLAKRVFDKDPKLFVRSAALAALDAIKGLRVTAAHQRLTIGSASPEIADRLKIGIGAPTLESHLVVLDQHGIAIYVADIIYRSDSIVLQIDLLNRS